MLCTGSIEAGLILSGLPEAVGNASMVSTGATVSVITALPEAVGNASMVATVAPEGFFFDFICPINREAILFTATGFGVLTPPGNGLTLVDVALKVYSLWGFQLTSLSQINIGLPSIVAWINSAMQLIYSQADRLEYFNRVEKTLTVTTSGMLALDADVQKILGPVRLSGLKKTLRALTSKTQMEQFSLRFLDDAIPAPSGPLAYYIESARASQADSVGLILYLVPSPTESTEILADICEEPTRYLLQDILGGQPLEIPHKWAETILLPLVMKWAMGDSLMPASLRQGVEREVNEQYNAAMTMLGQAEPEAQPNKKSKPREAAQAQP